jgi:Mn-containing catalase
MGNAWSANKPKIISDLAVDLRNNIATQARATIVYGRPNLFSAG